ncbi:MAG: class I SAM-dependent methyltransferase [Chloroflexi bacterium]|nr:class I SAM-dependent methyltransferase [Chloroflexota bacterium]MCI0725305.1 class I SAM-dependent methyltransferase [Chloroflexota bacterium]
MLTRLLHRIVAFPSVYNWVQIVAGRPRIDELLRQQFTIVQPGNVVLELGGGTGLNRHLLTPDCVYICLDNDPVKLRGFLKRHRGDIVLQGDASQVSIRDDCMDFVFFTFVSHHIPDSLLADCISEGMRVLKRTGVFIFLDIVWSHKRLISKLLWKYDRGSHPRSADTLFTKLSQQGKITLWKPFVIYHEYILAIIVPDPT